VLFGMFAFLVIAKAYCNYAILMSDPNFGKKISFAFGPKLVRV
jgi:hypothetical protein